MPIYNRKDKRLSYFYNYAPNKGWIPVLGQAEKTLLDRRNTFASPEDLEKQLEEAISSDFQRPILKKTDPSKLWSTDEILSSLILETRSQREKRYPYKPELPPWYGLMTEWEYRAQKTVNKEIEAIEDVFKKKKETAIKGAIVETKEEELENYERKLSDIMKRLGEEYKEAKIKAENKVEENFIKESSKAMALVRESLMEEYEERLKEHEAQLKSQFKFHLEYERHKMYEEYHLKLRDHIDRTTTLFKHEKEIFQKRVEGISQVMRVLDDIKNFKSFFTERVINQEVIKAIKSEHEYQLNKLKSEEGLTELEKEILLNENFKMKKEIGAWYPLIKILLKQFQKFIDYALNEPGQPDKIINIQKLVDQIATQEKNEMSIEVGETQLLEECMEICSEKNCKLTNASSSFEIFSQSSGLSTKVEAHNQFQMKNNKEDLDDSMALSQEKKLSELKLKRASSIQKLLEQHKRIVKFLKTKSQ